MRDELLDKSALVTSIFDRVAAEKEATGNPKSAEAARKLAETAGELGKTLRRILEIHEKRISALDEFAYPFKEKNGRFPTPDEQMAEMERIGLAKNGKWIDDNKTI